MNIEWIIFRTGIIIFCLGSGGYFMVINKIELGFLFITLGLTFAYSSYDVQRLDKKLEWIHDKLIEIGGNDK